MAPLRLTKHDDEPESGSKIAMFSGGTIYILGPLQIGPIPTAPPIASPRPHISIDLFSGMDYAAAAVSARTP
jgi:hypothetical protein